MPPLSLFLLCMWFWPCLCMWRGMKAHLKGRANTIKVCPYHLIRLEETDRHGDGSTAHPTMAPALNTVPSTNQTVSQSGLRLSFNSGLKHETTVYSLAWGSGGCWVCFFSHQPQQACLCDFLFSENVTFVDRGQPLFFLRGFVISRHLAKCCKSLHSKEFAL